MGRNRREDIDIQDPLLSEMLKSLSDNVKKKRSKLGITQAELAIRAQLAQNTIAEIEQGRVENIRLSTVAAVARGLETKPVQLLTKGR
jgi:predicted transcriptional regulator